MIPVASGTWRPRPGHPPGRAAWRAVSCGAVFAVLLACGQSTIPVAGVTAASGQRGRDIEWAIDSVTTIGGHPVRVVGEPRVVDTPHGRAVEFDGQGDGLFLEVNPLAGLGRFTVEVVFEPAPDGGEEQRFVHFEEPDTGNRALIELRLLPGALWCLDTFLRHGEASLTLIDRAKAHPSGGWHAAALTFDGQTMTHWVNGVRELQGPVAFQPLRAGRTSIGVRQNLVSWFKGRIRLIRITPDALAPGELLKANSR